ncbi:unnamed protein product [Paramecium primaurelia]|uniref:RuvB-like helicase n=1 Tax=Paramecium primaurelia TaxID=5886 RepID=A0A8S1PDU7_PARPR|nr:unnamed protein product [Paramecium primaurelia]
MIVNLGNLKAVQQKKQNANQTIQKNFILLFMIYFIHKQIHPKIITYSICYIRTKNIKDLLNELCEGVKLLEYRINILHKKLNVNVCFLIGRVLVFRSRGILSFRSSQKAKKPQFKLLRKKIEQSKNQFFFRSLKYQRNNNFISKKEFQMFKETNKDYYLILIQVFCIIMKQFHANNFAILQKPIMHQMQFYKPYKQLKVSNREFININRIFCQQLIQKKHQKIKPIYQELIQNFKLSKQQVMKMILILINKHLNMLSYQIKCTSRIITEQINNIRNKQAKLQELHTLVISKDWDCRKIELHLKMHLVWQDHKQQERQEIYSVEVKKTEIIMENFRSAIGLKIKETKVVWEGEDVQLKREEKKDQTGLDIQSINEIVSVVVITLKKIEKIQNSIIRFTHS